MRPARAESRRIHDQDIRVVYDIAHKPLPQHATEVSFMQLVPAFMLNELRVAFRIGFVILLPFLLIDIVVSTILLALGMLGAARDLVTAHPPPGCFDGAFCGFLEQGFELAKTSRSGSNPTRFGAGRIAC